MKAFKLTISFIFLLQSTWSQSPSVKWSKQLDGKVGIKFAGIYKSDIVITKPHQYSEKITIQSFDEELQIKNELLLPAMGSDDKRLFSSTGVSAEGIFQFRNEYDKKSGKSCLAVSFFDSELRTSRAEQELYCESIKNKPIYMGTWVEYSQDSSKVLLYHYNFLNHGAKQDLVYHVFRSHNWELLHHGVFEKPALANSFQRYQITVDNHGNVIQLTKITRTLKELKDGLPEDYVININRSNGTRGEFQIKNSILLASAKLFQPSDGRLYFTAFRFNFKKDQKNLKLDLQLSEINPDIDSLANRKTWELNGLYPEIDPSINVKRDDQFAPFYIKTLNVGLDNSFVFTAEQMKPYTENSNLYGKIAMIFGRSSDEIGKVNLLDRWKSSGDNPGYLVGLHKHKWVVIFDDEVNTLSAKSWDEYKEMSGSFNFTNKDQGLLMWSVDENGISSKQLIYRYSDNPIAPQLSASLALGAGKFLLLNEKHIGILDLK